MTRMREFRFWLAKLIVGGDWPMFLRGKKAIVAPLDADFTVHWHSDVIRNVIFGEGIHVCLGERLEPVVLEGSLRVVVDVP